jgi:hypothetical protein
VVRLKHYVGLRLAANATYDGLVFKFALLSLLDVKPKNIIIPVTSD